MNENCSASDRFDFASLIFTPALEHSEPPRINRENGAGFHLFGADHPGELNCCPVRRFF